MYFKSFFCLIFISTILFTSVTYAQRIDSVKAVVYSQNFLPAMVKERMEESISNIGNQLLSGKLLPLNQSWLKTQESTIHLVFDKILVGYTVNNVSINILDSTAIINVNLIAWSDTINQIKVNANVEGMPDSLTNFVINDLAHIDEVFNDCLKGLPIAAVDWTNGILKRRLKNFMELSLPEFRADFDVKIQSDSSAIIELNVYPKLPVVRTISLSMRSDTIPNIALLTHRTLVENTSNILIGVPVSFINRHKAEIESLIATPLDSQKDFKTLKIKSNVSIEPAERMNIMIRSNSSIYRMRASGWIDLARNSDVDDDLLFRLHIGRKLSNADETFARIDIKPQVVDWNFALGYSKSVKSTSASILYDFSDKNFIADLEYKFLKDWLIRYEHKFKNDSKETAIRYKLHDFLSVEYAIDKNESWLRFIGYF